jgi:hypothetical protein
MSRLRRAWDVLLGRDFSPRLLITSKRPIPRHGLELIRESLAHAEKERKPLFVAEGMTIWQLVDGRWQPLVYPVEVVAPKLSAEQLDQMRKEWQATHTGLHPKRWETLVLDKDS